MPSDRSNGEPRCGECGAALTWWGEPHTIEDCQAYRDLSPADQDAYEEAVRTVRSERDWPGRTSSYGIGMDGS